MMRVLKVGKISQQTPTAAEPKHRDMKMHSVFKERQSSSMEIKTQEKQDKTIHSSEDEDYSTSTTVISLVPSIVPGTKKPQNKHLSS